MLTSLNGWQRLWIVGSAFYVLLAGWIAVHDIQDINKQNQKVLIVSYIEGILKASMKNPENDLFAEISKYYDGNIQSLKSVSANIYEYYKSHNYSKLKAGLEDKYSAYVNFEAIEEASPTIINGLVYSFIYVVAPPLVLYFLGLMIAWVREGFQSNRKNMS